MVALLTEGVDRNVKVGEDGDSNMGVPPHGGLKSQDGHAVTENAANRFFSRLAAFFLTIPRCHCIFRYSSMAARSV